jgi:hypothetical protein
MDIGNKDKSWGEISTKITMITKQQCELDDIVRQNKPLFDTLVKYHRGFQWVAMDVMEEKLDVWLRRTEN